MSYQYKNKTENDLMIPGVGTVKAGATVVSGVRIENPNLELVQQDNTNNVVGTESPQPNAVVEAQPAEGTTGSLEVK